MVVTVKDFVSSGLFVCARGADWSGSLGSSSSSDPSATYLLESAEKFLNFYHAYNITLQKKKHS